MCTPENFSESSSSSFTNYSNKCEYILNETGCSMDSGFLNYYAWQYCHFSNHIAPTILMILWLLVLLLLIGITADSFFAPCLVVVTRIFRMSQNLAGVTLLALGNGAADVFSSLSAVTSGQTPNVGLAFGSLIGAGIFVNTVTAGIIMIIKPFHVTKRPVMKDLVFYLVALIVVVAVIITKELTIVVPAIFLTLYIVYVFVTGLSRVLYVKYFAKDKEKDTIEYESDNPETTIGLPSSNNLDGSSIFKKYQTDEHPSVYFHSSSGVELINVSSFGEINKAYQNTEMKNQINSLQLPTNRFNAKASENTEMKNQPRSLQLSTNRFNAFTNEHLNSVHENPIKVRRVPSTSHRKTGFLAQIIMTNEIQRNMHRKFSEIEVIPIDSKNRTQSVINTDHNPSRVRFMSVGTPRKESANFNTPRQFTEIQEENKTVDSNKMYDIDLKFDSEIKEIDQSPAKPEISTDEIIDNYYYDFPGIFWHFLYTILPFEHTTWSEQTTMEKIMIIIQSPLVFILTLTIPVVDDSSILKGWCKILNSLHCFISPLILIVLLQVYDQKISKGPFMILYLEIIIGFLFMITVFITSKANRPPAYHPLFAFLGFLLSIIWIYAIANEIVNILTVLGVTFSIPDTILGLSVLAIANSIGDLVSNITLAKRNYPRIAYAACIGGPLFNLLIGVGLPFAIKTADENIEVHLTMNLIVLLVTIIFVTVLNIIVLPILRFHARPPFGIVLVVIYVVFFVTVMLFATNTIMVKL